MLDEDGRVIEEGPDPRPELTGNKRTYRVWIDPNQYRRDMTAHENGEEVCQTCNTVYEQPYMMNIYNESGAYLADRLNLKCLEIFC